MLSTVKQWSLLFVYVTRHNTRCMLTETHTHKHTQRFFWFFLTFFGMGKGISVAFVALVMAVLAQVTSMILNKEAMSSGLSEYTLVVYSNALSTLILTPSSFIFHRLERPPLSFYIVFSFFLLGLTGCSAQIFGYVGIEYSSATLGTAMLNLIPAFTFILAIIFRMEKVQWRSSSSKAKIFGTIASITGAFVVTFYKGQPFMLLPSSHPLNLFSSKSNWVLGGLFLAADSFFTSLWYILQSSTLKKYPAVVVIVCFQCLFTTIQQSALFTLIAVKDANAWELRLDMGLIAVLYTAIVSIVLRYTITTWCVWKAGALFCSMFKPLGIIFGVIMSVIFLGDPFYFGSLVGALIIVTGFYAVMWGKAKEEKLVEGGSRWESLGQNKAPLLQNNIQEKHNCTSILCK